MKRRDYFGFGSIRHLGHLLRQYSAKRIFLVTGNKSYSFCRENTVLVKILAQHDFYRFHEFSKNPKLKDLARGIRCYKKYNSDIVVAIGGGSVIDMAKLVNSLAWQPGRLEDYILKTKKIAHKGKPLLAIPTTAGSGSEATRFAVVYKEKKKYALEHAFLMPDVAIIDPQLSLSLPPYITAATGMDALAQAIESYWSVHANVSSKRYARKAIRIILKNLESAVCHPTRHMREGLSLAAHLSGKAINITKTTACHAISYALTSYFNIAHGHAVGLTLGDMLVYNSQVAEFDLLDKRGVLYVKKTIKEINTMLECADAEKSKKKIHSLMARIGLTLRLSALGIRTKKDIKRIARSFDPLRAANNPRQITSQAVEDILINLS
jgi:alcohol dehydrogenase class IV